MSKIIRIIALTVLALFTLNSKSFAEQLDFQAWISDLKTEAISNGIDSNMLDKALKGLTVNERVIELDRNQPEFTLTLEEYLGKAVSMTRIKKGRKLYQEHNPILSRVEKHYHVQPRFLVALWGIETNYGEYTGGFSVIRSLVTLAYDERRSEFFRKELLLALKIINENHISATDMMGSWAGAMGQNQFMPSSFDTYAVDFNNDGKKDIWNDLEDIFASSSNYLSSQGWRSDITWGREVRIPDDFDENLATVSAKKLEINKKLSEWQSLGVRKFNGENLPSRDIDAYLVLPSGIDGRAYLVYENFKTLLKWNRSLYFAIAVGSLSDQIDVHF